MIALVQGQNTGLSGTAFKVKVAWSCGPQSPEIDVSAFMLEASGKVSGDEDMIFYGQQASRDGSVSIDNKASQAAGATGGSTLFAVDLPIVSASVEKIAFTATTPAATSPSLSAINSLSIKVSVDSGDDLYFEIDTSSSAEAAMIIGELYRRNDQWKFRAVGQGFEGGLAPLAEHFGVEVDDAGAEPTSDVGKVEATPSAPPAAASAPPAPTINLDKISLTKNKPSISLEKRGASLGELRVNLNWNQSKVMTKGFFGIQKEKVIDLDLCCLFALNDGGKGAVQALGHNFGTYEQAPWIHLQGDDRTGSVTEGEWLRINGAQWSNINKIVIFVLLYEGVPNWAATDGIVTLHVPDHPLVESRIDGESNSRVCAVAVLENDSGRLKMTQENKYFKSAKELDEHYGIGLAWTAGRK